MELLLLLLPLVCDACGAFHYHSHFAIYIVIVPFTALTYISYCPSPLNVRNAT
jgi:hypothetical protein